MRKTTLAILVGLICISTLHAQSMLQSRQKSNRPSTSTMVRGGGLEPVRVSRKVLSPAAKLFKAFNEAEILVIAEVTKVTWGPLQELNPMVFTRSMTLKTVEDLRGTFGKKGGEFHEGRRIKAEKQPETPKGKLICVKPKRGPLLFYPATKVNVDLAEIATGKTKDGLFDAFNQAETLVVVDALNVKWSRVVGRSMPPVRSATISGKVTQALRGSAAVGKTISGSHIERTMKQTKFEAGSHVLAISKTRGRAMVTQIRKADALTIALAQAAASVPLGWTPNSGPALLCGKGITMKVEKVPPVKEIKWTNGDGDGEYKITITNTNKKAVEVPALLNDGTKILWLESIKVTCQKKAQPAPGAKKLPAKTQPTTLKPGESVSCVVNALGLKGIEWPGGGYRIEFRFSIGELSGTQSFYYMSRHHDKLRAAAAKKFGGK